MEHPGTPSATPHAAAPDYSPTDPASTGRLRHWLGGTRLSRWYAGRSRRGQLVVELLLASALPPLLGFVVYYLVALTPARGALGVLFWVYFLALAATAVLIVMECARAFRFPEPPVRTPVPREQLPRVAAVIAAYLPNEQDTILDSIAAHLAVDYPADRHVVVVAYNAPEPLPIEAELVDLAAREPRLMTMRVQGSTSKVENVTAALHQIGSEVEVIGIFDADHHPHPKAPRRVAQWLSDAAGDKRFDMVQGQCAIRNDDEGFVARTVTAEFATLYGVAHPGRTVVNDFGIFGGSNGWWRAPASTRRCSPRTSTSAPAPSPRATASAPTHASSPGSSPRPPGRPGGASGCAGRRAGTRSACVTSGP